MFYKQGLWVRQQQAAARAAAADSSDAAAGSGSGGSSRGGGGSSGGGSAEDVVASHRSVALCLVQLGCDAQAEEHLAHALEVRMAEVLALNTPPAPGHDSPAGSTAVAAAGRHSRQASFAAAFGGAGGDDGVDWSILADGDVRLTKEQQDALLGMAAAAEYLGRCYSRQGKHSAAEELYWQALEARSQVLGARHELVQATEEQLRECLDRQC